MMTGHREICIQWSIIIERFRIFLCSVVVSRTNLLHNRPQFVLEFVGFRILVTCVRFGVICPSIFERYHVGTYMILPIRVGLSIFTRNQDQIITGQEAESSNIL